MPQGFVLYGQFSVRQNLNFVAGIYGLGFRERRRRVREALGFVELWGHRRKAAANVSGGMQRRLQLAATIVRRARGEPRSDPQAPLLGGVPNFERGRPHALRHDPVRR